MISVLSIKLMLRTQLWSLSLKLPLFIFMIWFVPSCSHIAWFLWEMNKNTFFWWILIAGNCGVLLLLSFSLDFQFVVLAYNLLWCYDYFLKKMRKFVHRNEKRNENKCGYCRILLMEQKYVYLSDSFNNVIGSKLLEQNFVVHFLQEFMCEVFIPFVPIEAFRL